MMAFSQQNKLLRKYLLFWNKIVYSGINTCMRTASSPNSLSKIFPLAIALAVLAISLIPAWQWRKNLSDEPGFDQKANQTVQSDEQSRKKPEPSDAKKPSSMDGNEPASSNRIKLEKKLKLANFSRQETTAVQRSVNTILINHN